MRQRSDAAGPSRRSGPASAPLVLGSTCALLGAGAIAWIWFERGELFGAGLAPIVIGLIVAARGRGRIAAARE